MFDISPEKYVRSGIPLVRVQNIKNGMIDDSNMVYLSEEEHSMENKTELGDFDFVLSKIGTVGEVALLDPKHKKWNFSQNVIGIKLDKVKISPSYILFFLLSKFGQLQIKRAEMGQVQAKLELEDIRNLKIIRIEGEKIFNDYLVKILKSRSGSELFYKQAENLLLEELGLKNLDVEENLSAIVNFSDILEARRMDAEYFQPKYENLLEVIKKKVKVAKLKDIANVKRGSLINPKFYSESGTPYLRGKDFSSGNLEKESLVYINDKFIPGNETRVEVDDIIFASIGSVGTLALINNEFKDSFISNNTAKISLIEKNYIVPDYFCMVLHSIVGKLQFEKESTQTAQPKISDSQVKNFMVPILPIETQQKIADLVRQSHEARKKAKELLEEAKRKVEEMIEKGGEKNGKI
ncbi:MAG TPA: restriction endonuclease subunit S [Candidatus Saccharimonadales bacterium]|nr:restriction endonuclease subunit S [Candidatus Saccharimonadales bacterium]